MLTSMRKRLDEAEGEMRRCGDRYLEMVPEKPKALLWRVGDPVGHCLDDDRQFWCNFIEIHALRGKTEVRYEFIGTEEEAETLPLLAYDMLGADPKYAGLFKGKANARQQRRADQLVAALDEYIAADQAATILSGIQAADEACEAIDAEMAVVWDRMAELQPATLDGYRAMFTAVVVVFWAGQIESRKESDEKMIGKMLSSLTGIPIEAATTSGCSGCIGRRNRRCVSVAGTNGPSEPGRRC